MTGHLLGGAGGIESVFSVMAIRDQVSPPTINLDNLDPECAGVDIVGKTARQMKIRAAMKNSFGFGGTNSTVIYKAFEPDGTADFESCSIQQSDLGGFREPFGPEASFL